MSPQTNNTYTSPSFTQPPQPSAERAPEAVPPVPIKQRKRPHYRWLYVLVLCVLAVWFLAAHITDIQDQWRLSRYSAPAAVSTIADQDTMTSQARKLFYINSPQITDKANFPKACPNKAKEQSIVLGCYHSVQNGIFLLHVTDERLSGVEQVTAAHETLHAAYDRLNDSERKKVDAMLMDYYNNKLTDARVKSEIELYKQTEPNDVVNEMHSVFGTEIASLPAPLEQYYQRYFTNRATVVGFADKYQAAFTSLQASVKDYDTQLTALKAEIDKLETSLNDQITTINDQQKTLKVLRVTDQAGYNAAVPGYNQLVNQYNSQAKAVQVLVARYNTLVGQRNDIAVQEQELTNALSTDTAPINQ